MTAKDGVAARVERHARMRTSALERRRIVASLRGAGLPTPPGFVGSVVDALGKAGLFRLRGTLVGTVAFQTYAGMLGTVLSTAAACWSTYRPRNAMRSTSSS